jgi:hypothetical protein
MSRRILPQRRTSENFHVRFWNQDFNVTAGRYPDGAIGKIFIDGGKSGQDVQSTARDAAILLSLALQFGATVETIRHAVTRAGNGEAASMMGAIVDKLAFLADDSAPAASSSPATDGLPS